MINPILTPSVNIAGSANNICSGTGVTFTVTSMLNGGASPTLTWKLNNNTVSTNSTSYSNASLSNMDVVKVEITSSELCVSSPTATSTGITMSVNGVSIPSVSITGSANNFCQGLITSVGYNAVSTNGGANPSYTWKLNNVSVGSGSSYTNTSVADGQTISVEMISTATCANPISVTSNIITLTVNSVPASPTAGVFSAVCVGSVSIFDLTATGIGLNSLKWYATNISNTTITAPTVNTANTGTTTGFVSQTTGAGCESGRTKVEAVVNANPTVSISATPTAICLGSSSQLSVTGAANYVWQDDNSTSNPRTVSPTATQTYTVTGFDSNNCSNTFVVNVTVNTLPGISASNLNNICIGSSPVPVFTASGVGLRWYTQQNGGVPASSPNTISSTQAGIQSVWVESFENNCPSASRVQVSITVDSRPTVQSLTYNNNGLYCSNNVSGIGLTNASAFSGGTFAGTGGVTVNNNIGNSFGSITPNNAIGAITITFTSAMNGACPSTRTSAVITITNYPGKPAISYGSSTTTEYCQSGNITAPSITVTNGAFTSNLPTNKLASDGSVNDLSNVAVGSYTINYSVAGVGGYYNCKSTKFRHIITFVKSTNMYWFNGKFSIIIGNRCS
ncbi:MAG: hypothetical protein EAZ53_03055 [Bacteroidetes bacterium]|nr:MAG: hypothetical protein EAZ53_03055 [Bacteroidota bacterium]